MKKDCGKLCIPAIKLGISLPVPWHKIIEMKWTPNTLRTAMLTGKHWTSNEALNGGIIDEEIDCESNEEFIEECTQFVVDSKLTDIAKNRTNYSAMKRDLYQAAIYELNKHIGSSKM